MPNADNIIMTSEVSEHKAEKEKREKNGRLFKTKVQSKKKKTRKMQGEYKTYDGHPLTPKEAKFIDIYIETGNQRQSVIEAGYTSKAPGAYAQTLLKKDYVANEIKYRLQKLEDEKTASAKEILEYFTAVMRGDIKDQFGLEAPLSERTRAAQELAKRQIDIVNRVSGKDIAEVTLKLNWNRD